RVALHVAECDGCRRQLREAEALAASLAYAVPAAAPPPDLRDRVLAAAEPVVAVVVAADLRRRRAGPGRRGRRPRDLERLIAQRPLRPALQALPRPGREPARRRQR